MPSRVVVMLLALVFAAPAEARFLQFLPRPAAIAQAQDAGLFFQRHHQMVDGALPGGPDLLQRLDADAWHPAKLVDGCEWPDRAGIDDALRQLRPDARQLLEVREPGPVDVDRVRQRRRL